MMRSSAYNRFGVLMGASWPTSCPRWYGLREDSLPMITLFPSQGDFCATASDEAVTESFIEIIDVGSGRHVITVIEMLSLANKLPGEGQELCRRKQQELRDGQVNLVEIDLLRV